MPSMPSNPTQPSNISLFLWHSKAGPASLRLLRQLRRGCLPIRRAARSREDPVAAAITAPPASPYFLDTVPAPASATAAGRPAW